MTPTWEQVRCSNYGTMGRTARGTVHRPDGSWEYVWHTPEGTWRYENESGEPTFIENATDSWSRGEDGAMVHTVKSRHTLYMTMGTSPPSLLLRAYDVFPAKTSRGFDDQRFVGPSAPRAVRVRGRDGWEVSAHDQHANETVTYVFDAELGIAVRWRRGEDWMELEDPILDDAFDPELFTWTGPSRSTEDDIANYEHAYEERQRVLARIPQALPTWLPMTTSVEAQSGDSRTGELSLAIGGYAPHFTLRRWVSAIGEPKLEWPTDSTPERHRQSIGDWTYEIRSHQEITSDNCARIVESIVPVDPPDRTPAEITAELAGDEHDRQEAEVLATLGTGRVLTDHLEEESLLIRTDFTDDATWRDIAVAAMAPAPQEDGTEFAAYLTCIDNPEYNGLTVDGLLEAIGEPPPYYAFLVDAATVRNAEMPIVTVYTGPDETERPRGRTFRVIPSEMCGVENNLSIMNMDFEDFADSADEDGVFRGFPELARPVEEVTTREIAHWIADDLHTDALREFHAQITGWKYRHPVSLFEAELAEVHVQARDSEHATRTELLGYDQFLTATSIGGPALRGAVWTHNGYWTFVIDRGSHRPIAAYRVTHAPYVAPAPQDGVPQPMRLEVPFARTEPVNSLILTDDDELVDRDAVQRAILVEAARLHPNVDIAGEPIRERIPRLPGFTIGCHVQIDGRPGFYVAIVTDVDDEFIVREVPPKGMRVVGPGEA